MNFECFINLLKEKNYIKEIRHFKVESEEENGYIAIDYECKYKEVKEKIMEEIDQWHACDLLHNIKYQTKSTIRNNEIKIIFVDKLEHHIWNKQAEEETKIYSENEVGYIQLEKIFKNHEFYEAKFNSVHSTWTITDLFVKKMREEKETKEKEECLNFLKQLP